MTMVEYDVLVKAVVVGDAGVGKSALLIRYTDNVFDASYLATIGVDFRISSMERRDKLVKLQVWDTAGQERFQPITQQYYRGAQGVAVCFDLTDLESFQHCEKWLADVRARVRSDCAIVLIGTKSDMAHKRVVTLEAAEAFAKHHGLQYVETSARNNAGVVEAFTAIVDGVLENVPVAPKPSEPKSTIIFGMEQPQRPKQRRCWDFLFH